MYGKGLALNSMEGKEAKHQEISRYAQNSNFLNRWKQVFWHEFVSLLWLRERGYNLTGSSSSKETYIPKRAFQNDHCYCGLPVTGECKYCNSPIRTKITKSVQDKLFSPARSGGKKERVGVVLRSTISCGCSLQSERRLWLQLTNRRICGHLESETHTEQR